MSNWRDLAAESRNAANLLVQEGYVRSAICRAYYAVYSQVTDELLKLGVEMPKGREGPHHAKVRVLVESNLHQLPRAKREALSRLVGSLYAMRVLADYSPSASVAARDCREAVSMMKKSFEAF